MTDSILSDIYYDPSNPAGFSGLSKLYRYVKSNNINISKSAIRKWLIQQDSYSLNKQSRKPKTTNIVVSNPDEQWSADLMDMSSISKDNDNYKYVLIVVDTFSKFLWALPLKNKTSQSVSEAFKQIFSTGRKPRRLRTDKGQEFMGATTKRLMGKEDVKQLFAQSEQKASISERAIKTIKSRIYRYFTFKNSFRYIDSLQDFVTAYNTSTHTATGFKPINVSTDNAESVRISKFLRRRQKFRPKRFKFKIGDKVRITYLKRNFNREYDHKWTGEIFTVFDPLELVLSE